MVKVDVVALLLLSAEQKWLVRVTRKFISCQSAIWVTLRLIFADHRYHIWSRRWLCRPPSSPLAHTLRCSPSSNYGRRLGCIIGIGHGGWHRSRGWENIQRAKVNTGRINPTRELQDTWAHFLRIAIGLILTTGMHIFSLESINEGPRGYYYFIVSPLRTHPPCRSLLLKALAVHCSRHRIITLVSLLESVFLPTLTIFSSRLQ